MNKTHLLTAAALALAVLFSAVPPLRAWNQPTHSVIADAAVNGDPDFQKAKPAPAESLEHLLASPGFEEYRDRQEFFKHFELNPAYALAFQLNETPGIDGTPGSPVAVSKIFEKYVQEPDWGMDQQVCAIPGYDCRDDEKEHMFALKLGLISQAFRHMYWKNYQKMGLGEHLLKTVPTSMGEAPVRSQLFFDLSVKAGKSGHSYWAYRFLAWSMHYAQDVTQPFHAAQIPSPRLMRYLKHTDDGIPDADGMAEVIAYYHLKFEKYMDDFAPTAAGSIQNAELLSAADASAVTLAAASFGLDYAVRTADAAIDSFPPDPKDPAPPKRESTNTGKDLVGYATNCILEAGSASKTLLALYKNRMRDGTALGGSSEPATQAAQAGAVRDQTRVPQLGDILSKVGGTFR